MRVAAGFVPRHMG
jgi:hypothetical protein